MEKIVKYGLGLALVILIYLGIQQLLVDSGCWQDKPARVSTNPMLVDTSKVPPAAALDARATAAGFKLLGRQLIHGSDTLLYRFSVPLKDGQVYSLFAKEGVESALVSFAAVRGNRDHVPKKDGSLVYVKSPLGWYVMYASTAEGTTYSLYQGE